MPVEITFIRHGQTSGNAAGRWQGHTNSSLTDLGATQAKLLGARLESHPFDLVVASDLDRTVETASALGRPIETDPRWREPFFGDWEDLTTAEITSRYGADLAALLKGEDIALGGGERLSAVMARTTEALDDVVERVGDGSVAIVSHGMALMTLLSGMLGTKIPTPLRLMGNTAIATVIFNGDGFSLPRYNDDTHLGHTALPQYGHSPDDTEVLLIRHGQTVSNEAGRWQGHTDGELNAAGRHQASLLATSVPTIDALYSSPLSRAMATADAIAAHQDLEIQLAPDLKEIGFGAWEGMTPDEIAATYPEDYAAFRNGHDGARGGDGETFAGVRRRMATALDEIVGRHPGQQVGVVSHGGATRAYVTEVLGLSYENRHRLSILGNTGYARMAFTRSGPSVVSWNLAPHLGS